MSIRKEFQIHLSSTDILDVTYDFESGKVTHFVLNYRTKIDDRYHVVYRVDTSHGFLHEQKFWISSKPIKNNTDAPLKNIFDEYIE